MKLYLASGAPGNDSSKERGMQDIPRRLLSYWSIMKKQFENHKIFKVIKIEKQ